MCSDAVVFVMSRIASEESDIDDPIDETDDTTRSGVTSGGGVLVEARGNFIAADRGGLDSLLSFERTFFIWRWTGPERQTKIGKSADTGGGRSTQLKSAATFGMASCIGSREVSHTDSIYTQKDNKLSCVHNS
jgi:hypothetical protein